jgi:hypothetical protein
MGRGCAPAVRALVVAALIGAGVLAGLVLPARTPAHTRTVVLPQAEITPGALNSTVRQGTIRKTICIAGWTRTVRPPASYTNELKREQMVAYGLTGQPSAYEEDHFIPLALGGAPRDPRNLWPEPIAQARHSDPLEAKLKRSVCKGAIRLSKARAAIRKFKLTNG